MELIYTNAAHIPQGVIDGFTLDMAYGTDENDFELTVTPESRLEIGALIYEYGTERGGVIDTEEYDSTGDVPVLTYRGRTWHGIMDNSIVRPDAGQPYLYLSGDLFAVFSTLINRQGLQGVLMASSGSSGLVLTNYQLPRYITLYEALGRLAGYFGKRLEVSKRSGLCEIGIGEIDWHTGGASENTPMVITNNARQTNHLVLLGKGDLEQRLVMDVYADSKGNVSQTQTLFGIDEVAQNYELSSQDDPSKLLEDGTDKLRDMQKQSEVVISVPSGEVYHVGDVVTGVAVEMGITAQAEIIKQIVSVDRDGTETISCMVGEPVYSSTK